MNDDWYTKYVVKSSRGKNKGESAWKQIQNLYCQQHGARLDDANRWIFRGEKKSKKDDEKYLRTSLEKAFENYGIRDDKLKNERIIIREFQRKASLYIEGGEPDKDDILEWLALMRHYGAPVRIMDWTYSYYIAVYFALVENTNGAQNMNGVVWALNAAKINTPKFVIDQIPKGRAGRFWEFRHKFERKDDVLGIREKGDKLDDLAIACYLIENPLTLVYPVNPFRLNKRLTSQQGLSLLTGNINKSFKENLRACFNKNDIHQITIECDQNERNEILWYLRNMNITNEVLFPSLDGFAKSTGELLAYPKELRDRGNR